MRRTPYQQALDEIGANRKLREEIAGPGVYLRAENAEGVSPWCEAYGKDDDIAITDLEAMARIAVGNSRNPARYEWVKLAVTLALLGLSVWLAVWLIGRHG